MKVRNDVDGLMGVHFTNRIPEYPWKCDNAIIPCFLRYILSYYMGKLQKNAHSV